MIIQEIPYHSPWYEAAKALRDKILRRPLGLVLSAQDIAGEAQQRHFAALEDEELVGTVILKPLTAESIKLRQMAVADSHQGKGLGRQIVRFAEDHARQNGFTRVELHARMYAQRFYEKLGYTSFGEAFTEVTLSTIKMQRELTEQP